MAARRPVWQRLAVAVALALLVAGCLEAAPEPAAPTEDPNVPVYVSNQSFEQPTADLLVTIDGVALFDGDAEVEGQHNWMLREAALAPGTHKVEALERDTGTRGSKLFNLPAGQERWIVVDYWTGTSDDEDPHFTISVHDEAVAFA